MSGLRKEEPLRTAEYSRYSWSPACHGTMPPSTRRGRTIAVRCARLGQQYCPRNAKDRSPATDIDDVYDAEFGTVESLAPA